MASALESINGCRNGIRQRRGEFFKNLSDAALSEWMLMEQGLNYGPNLTLFAEKQPPTSIYVVLQGEVRLSINSTDGKRLSLRIARQGEIVGLTAMLTGNPYEMTAETLFPSKIAPIGRRDFHGFLARNPEAYPAVVGELSRQMVLATDQLRTVGLAGSAPEKLARLLLEWSESEQSDDGGARVRFSMTHEEIGQFIGASRETVTRTLTKLKRRRLVSFRGSMLEIPNRTALAVFASM